MFLSKPYSLPHLFIAIILLAISRGLCMEKDYDDLYSSNNLFNCIGIQEFSLPELPMPQVPSETGINHKLFAQDKNSSMATNYKESFKIFVSEEFFESRIKKSPNRADSTMNFMKKFFCSIKGCSVYSFWQKSLALHILSHSDDKRCYCCDEPHCHAIFTHMSTLMQHRKIHLSIKKFKCTFPKCKEKFLRGAHLNQHMRTHSVTYDHTCEDCLASFRTEYDLQRHQNTPHKIGGFRCHACKSLFNSNGRRLQHKRRKLCKKDVCVQPFTSIMD